MAECIFCKIGKGEVDSDLVYEDEEIFAFADINPQAPVHLLILPRKHITAITEVEDFKLVGDIHKVAVKLAEERGLTEDGFRIVNNCGSKGGQTVDHLHFHLLGGRQLKWPPG